MFVLKVFAAFALALVATAQDPPNSPAEPTTFLNCSSPDVVNVPLSEFINVTWHVYASNVPLRIECQTITVEGQSDSAKNGTFIDYNSYYNNSYPWTSYEDGILTLSLGSNLLPKTLVFQYYSDKSKYKVAVFYTCLNPDYHVNYSTVIVAASVPNLAEAKVNALKQQVIAADPNPQHTKFVPIDQTHCRKTN